MVNAPNMERIRNIIEYNQRKVIECFNKDNKIESHVLNHIWRIFLQLEDKELVKAIYERAKSSQLPDGGWGYTGSEQSIVGITATVVQLLFWSKHVLRDDEQICNQINCCIKSAINYILEKSGDGAYWSEPTESNIKNVHGLIDVNHYISQVLFYYLSEHDNHTISQKYQLLCNWYVSLQCADGGWHEVDKIRSRIGTTADAVRALLPNKLYRAFIVKGSDFLVNNQNVYSGYWANGNRDKCFDAMKTLLATSFILNLSDRYYESICLGTDFLLTFNTDAMGFEEMCDILSILIDIYMFFSMPEYEKKFF